jgi:ubiquinone biosynthesis protein UbiJ
MLDKAPSTNPSSDQSLDIVERLYQLAHSTAVAAGKPNLARHAEAEREAAEEIRKLRRRIEGLEIRLNRLQEEAARCA